MVRVKNPNEYRLIGFEVSNRKDKMYNAILMNKQTKRELRVPFGDPTMENYRDITGLNAYPYLIHGNKERRRRFRLRHGRNARYKFSSAYFSYYYLW